MHTLQCLNHVSMATGDFAAARATGHRRVTATMNSRQQIKFNAMATYNRRANIPMASMGGTQLARIRSGREHFFGGASLKRLASHIGRPRFNALARLASSSLRSSLDARQATTACAAVAARQAPQQGAVQVQYHLAIAAAFAIMRFSDRRLPGRRFRWSPWSATST